MLDESLCEHMHAYLPHSELTFVVFEASLHPSTVSDLGHPSIDPFTSAPSSLMDSVGDTTIRWHHKQETKLMYIEHKSKWKKAIRCCCWRRGLSLLLLVILLAPSLFRASNVACNRLSCQCHLCPRFGQWAVTGIWESPWMRPLCK